QVLCFVAVQTRIKFNSPHVDVEEAVLRKVFVENLFVLFAGLVVACAVAVLHELAKMRDVDFMRERVGGGDFPFQITQNGVHLKVAGPTSKVSIFYHVACPTESVLRTDRVSFAQIARLPPEPRVDGGERGVCADQPSRLVVGCAYKHEAFCIVAETCGQFFVGHTARLNGTIFYRGLFVRCPACQDGFLCSEQCQCLGGKPAFDQCLCTNKGNACLFTFRKISGLQYAHSLIDVFCAYAQVPIDPVG